MGNPVESTSLAPPSPVRFFKTIWGAVATLLCVLLTFILASFAAVLARLGWWHALTALSRFWARMLITMCGVTVEIEGLNNLPADGYVLVCNHQSFFDIFACTAYIPGQLRFVAKRELMKIPLVGYAMKNGGHIVIDRQAGGREIRKAIDVVHRGYNLCVFAEGHRSTDNRVHEFKDAAAWLATLTKLPAVPMAISGSGAFFPRLAKIVVPGGRMRMTIGQPIPTEGLKSSDRAELTRKLEDAVRAMFVEEV